MSDPIMVQYDEVERPATPKEIAWIEVVRESTPSDEQTA
jgi:hypothetical protein